MPDTTLRIWSMLRLIPMEPQVRSTGDLHQMLEAEGFRASRRTIERDLQRMTASYGYTFRTEGRTQLWYWLRDAAKLDIPGIDPAAALALLMARQYLERAMPPRTGDLLRPWYEQAERTLGATGDASLARWKARVRIIDRGPHLLPPSVDPAVQREIYDALMMGHVLEAHYRARGGERAKALDLHPLGLVFREAVGYLVAMARDYERPSHYALHRFSSARRVDRPARTLRGFDFDHYIAEEQAFGYPLASEQLKLVMELMEATAVHLEERPLSRDQKLGPARDGWRRLTATVTDTQDLRWWLRSLGEEVRIVSPRALRQAMVADLRAALKGYEEG